MARVSRISRPLEDILPLLLPSHLTQEDRLNLAIDVMRESGYNHAGHTLLSVRSAAKLYGVPPTTLSNRFSARTSSCQEAHIHQQALNPAEEDILICFIKESGACGVPCTKQSVYNYASSICNGRYIGQHWVNCFLDCHPDLKQKVTQPLESCRASALNCHTVADFFAKLIHVITKYNIPIKNIYNMDEKGVQLGQGRNVLAIVDRELKMAYQIEQGSREMVTVIECISADGSALNPMVIFPLKRHDLACTAHNTCKAR